MSPHDPDLPPLPTDGGCTIQCDGSSRNNPGPAGIGIAVLDAAGNTISKVSHSLGERTNNQAEYEALIYALTEAATLPPPVTIQLDSELVFRQLEGQYRVRNELLMPLYERARALLDSSRGVTLVLVARGQNKLADRLARAASGAGTRPKTRVLKGPGAGPGPADPGKPTPSSPAPNTPETDG